MLVFDEQDFAHTCEVGQSQQSGKTGMGRLADAERAWEDEWGEPQRRDVSKGGMGTGWDAPFLGIGLEGNSVCVPRVCTGVQVEGLCAATGPRLLE